MMMSTKHYHLNDPQWINKRIRVFKQLCWDTQEHVLSMCQDRCSSTNWDTQINMESFSFLSFHESNGRKGYNVKYWTLSWRGCGCHQQPPAGRTCSWSKAQPLEGKCACSCPQPMFSPFPQKDAGLIQGQRVWPVWIPGPTGRVIVYSHLSVSSLSLNYKQVIWLYSGSCSKSLRKYHLTCYSFYHDTSFSNYS